MRKASKLIGGCLLVAMFVVLPVAGASAATKPVLVLKSGGTAVANGSESAIGVTAGGKECGLYASGGTVVANSAATDVVTATSSSDAECPFAGESIGGTIEEVSLKAKNPSKAKVKGTITYTSGECVYSFTKFKAASLALPGYALLEATSKGKLAKTSPKTCPKITETFYLNLTNEVFGESFQAELS